MQKYATPLDEATTPSLEALKAYSLGHKTQFAKGDTAALPFYKRAVELDPNFAMAYLAIAGVYSNLNEVGRAAENARKAYELRDKVSERERFSHRGILLPGRDRRAGEGSAGLRTVAADLSARRSCLTLTWDSFTQPWKLGKVIGREPGRQCDWSRTNGINYLNLGGSYVNLNRLDEAEAVYKQAEERKLESEGLLANRYQLAFLKGDTAQMAQLAAAAMGKPGMEDLLLAMQADTDAWHGKLKNARELTRRAMDSAQHNDAKETAAGYQAAAALREVESGNREQARADADAAVKLAPNRDVQAMAALALARAGDTARRRSWQPNSTRHSRWTRWSRGIGCPRSGPPSPCNAKTRIVQSNY